MSRLYLRIYLAVLGAILIFALLAALAVRLTDEAQRLQPRLAFVRGVAERVVPPPHWPPAAQREALERLRRESGLDLALFGADGRLVADASDGLFRRPPRWGEGGWGGWRGPHDGPPPAQHWRRHRFAESVSLSDGRTLVAARPPQERPWWAGVGPLYALAGVALAVGIAAYPVVRRLTRRLETLQASVQRLGQGDLAARVPVEGKDEIARLAETFNGAAARIEQLIAANRALLANASHELRSPLARLRMGIEGLETRPPSPERVAELSRNIRELDQLIDEILLASRLDGGGELAFRPEPFDLVALVAEECAAAEAAFSPGPGLPAEIWGDPRLLRRLIRNLVENARRHGGGAAEVELAALEPGWVVLDVADRGPGVAEAERERIFEPFYRARGASEAAGGVGLGLALVRQIAERHGGSARCLPREGGGSLFRVRLPAKRPSPVS